MHPQYWPWACVCLCLCLSVCHKSVTSRSFTKTAKRRITQTTPHDSPGTLVFWCQRSPRNSSGVCVHVRGKRPPCRVTQRYKEHYQNTAFTLRRWLVLLSTKTHGAPTCQRQGVQSRSLNAKKWWRYRWGGLAVRTWPPRQTEPRESVPFKGFVAAQELMWTELTNWPEQVDPVTWRVD